MTAHNSWGQPMADGTTIAWFHCFSGVSGDMAAGALIDAGADFDEVTSLCDRLPVDGWELDAEPVFRGGLAATRVIVRQEATSVIRTAAHITALIDEARLPPRVRDRAHGVFDALAVAEGHVHGRAPDKVHFHEVGSLSAIVNVVAVCAALEVLGIDRIHCSSVALGRGMVKSANGMLPVPRPVTLRLLLHAPTYGVDVPTELTSPTGAALLSSMVSQWGVLPAMTIEASGFGAGKRDLDNRSNVTQVVLGAPNAALPVGQPVTLLEANIDDATGETLAHAVEALIEAGAQDVWLTPIVMPKGRPAHTLSAVTDSALADQVATVLTAETGVLAIRGQRIESWPAARVDDEVDVEGRTVGVKVSAGRVKVQHDDAARAARHIGISVRDVISLAEQEWRRREGADLTEVRPLNPVEPSDDIPSGEDPDIA